MGVKWRGRDGENGKGRDIWGGGVEKEIGEKIRVKWIGREDEGKKEGKLERRTGEDNGEI